MSHPTIPAAACQEHNIISVSGGKDSTALLLLAIERETENLQAVFADTGHEHQQTYDYVRYLEQATGVPIRWVRADFAERIANKAAYVREKWMQKLAGERPGEWVWNGRGIDPSCAPPAAPPADVRKFSQSGDWHWTPPYCVMSQAEAQAIIDRALAVLEKGPTGNPFLDLCIWKGRFPSTKARFCSEELKRNPIIEHVQMPLLDAGHEVISWQGVRADESPSRALLKERDCVGTWPQSGGELWNYRPILRWKVEQVFDMHRKHGIKPNPLYQQGMGRVGCMPCIHARKDELLEISRRFPQEIDRVAEWERIVAQVSKRGMATFFPSVQADPASSRAGGEISHQTHGVHTLVEWSKTSRGGRQYDFLRADSDYPACSSNYGLCE